MSEYIIALYSRLSAEDKQKGTDDSNSIANQKNLLDSFLKKQEEFSNKSFKAIHIWDDGYSGTNFERPGIIKLLDMARCGNINCIIVKDFSRFGRNYIEVGTYLEQIFPFLGIRFISVNDFFDSKYNMAAGSLDIGFKNLMHDNYAQETSRKVSQAKLMRTNMGLFVGSFAFFGYIKADKNRLEIDEPAAKIVRYIFELRIQGLSLSNIARRLNEENIMTPNERKRQLGCNLHGIKGPTYWTQQNIATILYDERYTGKLIYRKTKRKSMVSFERVKTSKDEWIVVENCFEPIVSAEIFNQVQTLKRIRKEPASKEEHLLKRLIKCGCCGKSLTMRGKFPHNYYCQTRRYFLEKECRNIKIGEDKVISILLKLIKLQADIVLNNKERKNAEISSNKGKYHRQIITLQRVVDRKDAELFNCYEKYKGELINKDEFILLKAKIEQEAKEAQETIDTIEIELHKITAMEMMMSKNVFDIFEKCRTIEMLDREIIVALVSKIIVYNEEKVEIVWKYQDYLEV